MKVSFIGLGRMGSAMAGRLLAAGHNLTVFNRTVSKAAPLVKIGAKLADSLADAARSADVIVTMLENDTALDNVALGPNGLVKCMSRGAIHVAMGTHGIDKVVALTDAHRKAGQILVGAPVLGRPPAAEQGQIGIIAGGPPAAVKKCKPLFEAMGRRTFDGGKKPSGAAAAKIANNLVLACAIEAMGEGFVLAERCGMSGAAFLDVLADGLFNCAAYQIYGKIIAEKAYFGPPAFTAIIGLKDVNLALAAGDALAMPLPGAGVCRDRLLSAIAHGDGGRDWAVMALEQARASGTA
jgi:3-hydroxyisobutyrate dehydrogenase-like beta-hydroxyacid dehydrogenase